jgi:hypothetical protein
MLNAGFIDFVSIKRQTKLFSLMCTTIEFQGYGKKVY